MVKRINTKISKPNHEKLKNFSDGSIDKNLNLLMDKVENHMPFVNYNEKMVSVNLYTDTCERLDGFHITGTESRDNIITRMFLVYQNLEHLQNIEIPFRLSSPLNKELVIEGVATQTGIVIPQENNSLEYKAWVKLLNFEEIHSLILEHQEERFSFSQPHYNIDINYI